MPRLFFAAAVPAALAAEIAALQQHLRRRGYRGSFPDPAGLHLTFAFLGEVPEQHIPALTRLLEATAAATPPSALWLSRWGRFGPPGEPHVLWVGPGRVPGSCGGCSGSWRRGRRR
ncbi:protein of unknown function [Candidatus Hydrogenisulfobacillus filiaventi]|uniref:Phosphoesterase HXTX domain-containing protein n=1 Tax=Candidatus Hydrogenisulfobacillus filiaventi TaxID=2707344 RepID=A0A6F8ZGM4_9FIRM|nr:protein of unknown function [Candidatus Hydrogenisulfobacillus filiaventi]